MKAEDMGFNTKTGYHTRLLTRAENVFVGILWDHVGRDNRLSANELAARFDAEYNLAEVQTLEAVKRDCRILHNHILLYHDQVPILSAAGTHGGYWIAESNADAVEFYDAFRKRGMTGIVKASRGRKAALVDMMQQLSFEFDELTDRSGQNENTGWVRQRVDDPTPIEVVDAFLERMTRDPEKFSDGLRKIGAKYGGVLLPKEQIALLKNKTAELSLLMEKLQIA
ncbi:MAG: hypothetical protein FP814_05420 [Desulfobacterium sp.]|nr:hypothetical protein [Desulfobacteraceae bacterium]MBA3035917.1 hypothetical protein [Desulfobacterium sp.]